MEEIIKTSGIYESPTVVDTITEVEIIDTLQIDSVVTDKKLGKPIRGYRGRFVIGNRESVGNKGGRPRNITRAELLADEDKLNELVEKYENGDPKAFDVMLKIFEGRLK